MSEVVLTEPVKHAVEEIQQLYPNRPVCEIWHWYYFGFYLVGDVRNHPRLGNRDNVRTTSVKYINEEIGVAVTQNTVYVLREKAGRV